MADGTFVLEEAVTDDDANGNNVLDVEDDLGILDISAIEESIVGNVNDETWLVSAADGATAAGFTDEPLLPEVAWYKLPASKKSLVQKLDDLRRGSPTRSGLDGNNGFAGPSLSSPIATYLANQRRLSSTPLKLHSTSSPAPHRYEPIESVSPIRQVATHANNGDSTFTFEGAAAAAVPAEATFTLDGSGALNNTFTKQPDSNSTFTRPPAFNSQTFSRRRSGGSDRRLDRAGSGEDDGVSSTSDGSLSHTRMYEVEEVQHMAKMQEESLRQTFVVQASPTSEMSSNRSEASESLPDSPYSSQSLESLQMQELDFLRRSMPNLSRRGLPLSRGAGRAPAASSGRPSTASATSAASRAGAAPHHRSDPRLQQPNRMARASAVGVAQPAALKEPLLPSSSRLRPASSSSRASSATSRLAPPRPSGVPSATSASSGIPAPTSGIPRPGSRLPVFASSTRPSSAVRGRPT